MKEFLVCAGAVLAIGLLAVTTLADVAVALVLWPFHALAESDRSEHVAHSTTAGML